MDPEFVTIAHPDINGLGMCSAAAFDLIYEAKGWQRVDDPTPLPTPVTTASEPSPDPSAEAEAPAAPAPTPVNLLES